MDNIHILDNFLQKEELDTVAIKLSSKKWEYGHTSVKKTTPFWSMELIKDPYFTEYLKEIIEKTFSKKYVINRVYGNGQTSGQDGSFHIDDKNDNAVTVCFYINNVSFEDNENAGGNLVIKLPENKYDLSIEPRNNRLVLFPSKYLHRGLSFHHDIKEIRICIAWKLMIQET